MDEELPENPDLAWELDDFNHRQRAMDFVKQFESTMCVYSASVEQIYTSYNMFFPQEWDSKLVIIPDPAVFHDTFFHITPNAVGATGLYIIPGELIEKKGLFLANVDENRSLGKRQFPFETALRAIIKNRPAVGPAIQCNSAIAESRISLGENDNSIDAKGQSIGLDANVEPKRLPNDVGNEILIHDSENSAFVCFDPSVGVLVVPDETVIVVIVLVAEHNADAIVISGA